MAVSIHVNPEILQRKYSLIALDLDGTLLRSDKSISEATKKALIAAKDQGYTIVIATGRHPKSAVRYLDEIGCLNEKSCAICFNGGAEISTQAYIDAHDEVNFPVLHAEYGSAFDVMAMAKFAHSMGCKLHAYSRDRGLVIEDQNPYTQREIDHGQVGFLKTDFENLDKNERFFKFLVVGEDNLLDKVRANIPDFIHERFEVMRSDPSYLEFIPGPSTKGSALKALCQTLNIPISEAVAFGDAENDIAMLKTAGLGVAMGNAASYVKDEGDIVTLTNDEDGIAAVVLKLLNR